LSEIQTDVALLQKPEPFVQNEDIEEAVNDEDNLSESRTKHSGTSPDNESGTLQSRAKHSGSLLDHQTLSDVLHSALEEANTNQNSSNDEEQKKEDDQSSDSNKRGTK
nr:nucleic acid-binding, OB-fold-like protein [Tanacetum cinerariifolium]